MGAHPYVDRLLAIAAGGTLLRIEAPSPHAARVTIPPATTKAPLRTDETEPAARGDPRWL